MIFLIPSFINDSQLTERNFPNYNLSVIKTINIFIVENLRSARRFLISIGVSKEQINCSIFFTMDKNTDEKDIISFFLENKGKDIGIISEAGVACVADPGSKIVLIAHKNNIKVSSLIGPSSILLALSASGLNGQNFAFNGYLPIEQGKRISKIRQLEGIVEKTNQTQIFIETPYRNLQLFNDIINTCKSSTLLCIASDITAEDEFIKTQNVNQWKTKIPNINKKPSIFIIGNE